MQYYWLYDSYVNLSLFRMALSYWFVCIFNSFLCTNIHIESEFAIEWMWLDFRKRWMRNFAKLENSLFPNPRQGRMIQFGVVYALLFLGWKSLSLSLSLSPNMNVNAFVCMANIGLICLCVKLQGVAGGGATHRI